MESPKVSAVSSLFSKFYGQEWLHSIAVDSEGFVVYTKVPVDKSKCGIPDEWDGKVVSVRTIGNVRPAFK